MLMQKLDTTDDTDRMGSYVVCTPHSCQVKDDVSALSCLYTVVVFTDQPRALKLLRHGTESCFVLIGRWMSAG